MNRTSYIFLNEINWFKFDAFCPFRQINIIQMIVFL